jgi:sarcosine oxidase subunit beta
MKKTTDIIIIGGGITGAWLAYTLSKQLTTNITLIEKGRIASGSTGLSGGIVRGYHPDPYLSDLACESLPYYHNFSSEIDLKVSFKKTGFLYFEPQANKSLVLNEVNRLNHKFKYKIQLLSKNESQNRFPDIIFDESSTTVFEPDSGYIDPISCSFSLINKVKELGVVVSEGVQVKNIIVDGSKTKGVETNCGTVYAPIVIVAAGAWSKQIVSELHPELSLRPKKIQVCVFDRPHNHLSIPAFIDDQYDLNGRPDVNNSILIGHPCDVWDFDPDFREPVELDHAALIRKIAFNRFPWAKEATLLGGYHGYDGYTPDKRGLIQTSEKFKGLIFATGWSGGGFKTAPAVSNRVCDLIKLELR